MLSSFKKSPVEQETIGCYSIFQVGSLSYYKKHRKEIEKEYRDSRDKLTSMEFWENYLGI